MSRVRNIIKSLLLLVGVLLYRNKKSKILYYHDVHDNAHYTDMGTSLELFKKHIEQIRRSGFEIVPVISKSEGQVALMFDDGFRGIYDCRDYFYKQGIKPTIFLAVSLIGQPGYLGLEEIRELQQNGFIFQSHGWQHQNMAIMSNNDLVREVVEARQYLSDHLSVSVDEICLPIGYFSDRLLALIEKENYREVYSSIPGDFDTKIFRMRRRNLVQNASPCQVDLILKGGNNLIAKRYLNMHYL